MTRILLLLALLLQMAVCALADQLTKDALILMHQSGVSDAVIAQKIKADGISFDPSVNDLIELKGMGFTDVVLNSLLESRAQARSADAQLRGWYDEGKYDKVADWCQAHLKENPKQPKIQALYALVLLRTDQADAARTVLASLKEESASPGYSGTASRYAHQVQATIDSLARSKAERAAVLQEFKSLQADRARQAIRTSTLTDSQKTLLEIQADVYEAKFDSARDRTKALPASFSEERAATAALLKHVGEWETAYQQNLAKTESYLYSPLAASSCLVSEIGKTPDFNQLSLKEYSESVSTLVAIAPLSSRSLDLIFHASMLQSPYTTVQSIGERILAGKGNIHVPFIAADRFFDVVIDTTKAEIYTVSVDRPYSVEYSIHAGFSSAVFKSSTRNSYMESYQEFRVKFADLRSVRVHMGRWRGDNAGDHILTLEPGGTAPEFALMQYMWCKLGEGPAKNAGRNLGLFIQHAVDTQQLQVEVPDPSKHSSAFLDNFAAAMLGATAAMGGYSAPLAQAGTVMLQQQMDARNAAMVQQQEWQATLDPSLFATFDDSKTFQSLEELLSEPSR